ncbi:MAG: TldD/PmbA family protein [Desulfurococcaceae archaeon]
MDERVLHYVLDRGTNLGASYVEARYQRDHEFEVIVRNGKLLGANSTEKKGVGIRVIADNVLSFSSSNRINIRDLLDTVESAVSKAKAISKFVKSPVSFSNEKLGSISYSVTCKRRVEDLTIEDVLELGKNIYESAKNALREAKLQFLTFTIKINIQEKMVINTDGAFIRSRIPRIHAMYNMVLSSPHKGVLQRVREFGGTGGLELISQWDIPHEAGKEAANLENVLLNGVQPPSEKLDIVLGPEVVGLIVHESAGHPMEADRILGREAAQAGESFVKPYMIGKQKIGNEFATVIEDPGIPGSYGFYLYDDEGVRARPRYLYKSGIVNEPLHNRHTAYLFNTSSNGASRSMDYASEPIVRMSNTYLQPGEMDFEELIEDIEFGIYIKSYMEWNIDDIRWNQRYVGLESYLITHGELSQPVRNPVIEFTTKWFYSNIVSVDKNLMFYPGTCGKGEPSQGVPVWFGGPNVRLTKARVGMII